MTEDTIDLEPYKTLVEARTLLASLAESFGNRGHTAAAPEGYNLTRAAVACEDAESAVFNVLNVLHSYLRDEDASRALGTKSLAERIAESPEVSF